jgi:hypothetical protein
VPATASTATLQTWQLAPIIDAAYQNWARALGTSTNALKTHINLTFAVSDLGGSELGSLSGTSILIDDNAAGNGWFIDATPKTNTEFRRNKAGLFVASTGAASHGIDLLTTVMHEIGHALGLPDQGTVMSSLMYDTLGIGQRKLPGQYANVLSLLHK